jgi:hypothetical protein
MRLLPSSIQPPIRIRRILSIWLILILIFAPLAEAGVQDTLTGAFEGVVLAAPNKTPMPGILVRFTHRDNGMTVVTRTKPDGTFFRGKLISGFYNIQVIVDGYEPYSHIQPLIITKSLTIVPVPITLIPLVTAPAAPQTTPTQPVAQPPAINPTPTPTPEQNNPVIAAEITAPNVPRDGSYSDQELAKLTLGGVTLTRTFDELALYLPGVAPPPQAIGGTPGPGVGPGVGTSGQFAVNGLRSRANNFTVDGSDNNDEDIGVRRQGFLSLVPQSIESLREYHIITNLAPAQFGRNLGAQVNAVSRSGGSDHHGTLYGLFNSSQLNAREFFDRVGPNSTTNLMVGTRPVTIECPSDKPICLGSLQNGNRIQTRLDTGAKDSFTLTQPGGVLGGPLGSSNLFYFVTAEGQFLNSTKEHNFAVPTVSERGAFGTGAVGLSEAALPNGLLFPPDGINTFPTTVAGDAIFSLFPFPNNPSGVYGGRTYSQVLPANGRGRIASGKIDYKLLFAGRYNFTDDERDLPAVGGALFSSLISRVRTQNLSLYTNTETTRPNSGLRIGNQFRFSYGRTRLVFDERRDTSFLLPITEGIGRATNDETKNIALRNLANEPFFLNARLLANNTLTSPNSSAPVKYLNGNCLTGLCDLTTLEAIGPVGQVTIAGYSPVGVDVLNFPQRRVNNTYQLADLVNLGFASHFITFGADFRRTDLNSDLPRNARPSVVFNGAPRLIPVDPFAQQPTFEFAARGKTPFIDPLTQAAAGAPTNLLLSISNGTSAIRLRYYQLNYFAQDDYRVKSNFSISFGLRYEYNTVPHELDRRIESTFSSQIIGTSLPGLRSFLAGRDEIYAPDRNNFAPRIGFAYSPTIFGKDRATVIRAGYGLYYDQILGAVVSQSRNVFPSFLTTNSGGKLTLAGGFVPAPQLFNLLRESVSVRGNNSFLVTPLTGRPNALNPNIKIEDAISALNQEFAGRSIFGATLPAKDLPMPMAHQYSFTLEQQLGANTVLSAAYVGTQGRNLLRFTTPNLGEYVVTPLVGIFDLGQPVFVGFGFDPGFKLTSTGIPDPRGGRPVPGVGAITQFETTAESRYDALQMQLRGHGPHGLQYQLSYTFSKVIDDVSDVFDLAGASALPQRSCSFGVSGCGYRNERAVANFDIRHRFTYNFIYSLPYFRDRGSLIRFILGGLEVAGTGQIQTGQPFSVNSTSDVNLDGNLTDRLNSTAGIVITENRRRRLQLTSDPALLLANPGEDGKVGRNTFRASGSLLLNLALIKNFNIGERQRITFRTEFFNFTNRANFGIPVRLLEAPGFGEATLTTTPGFRTQFALKYSF